MTDNENLKPETEQPKKEEIDPILNPKILHVSSNSSDPNDWCPGEGPHPSD